MTGEVAAVRMHGIEKHFGSVRALRGADLVLASGEVHALLGENGAGKSTLMHVLFGLQTPDAGSIEVGGRSVRITTPRAAAALGIGMVHQHFTQVPRLTVAENVWLGRRGVWFDRRVAEEAVARIGTETGLELDPRVVAEELPVGLRQRLEIVKALAGDVRVLILDKPTAALAPVEVEEFFVAVRRLAAAGVAVMFITHKLREVAAVSGHVTVLRQGAVVLAGPADRFEADGLARAMVGTSADDREVAEALERSPSDRLVAQGAPAAAVAGLQPGPGRDAPPEEGDTGHAHTALREAREEVGIDPAGIEILGELPDYHTSTGFRVRPVVGWAEPPVTWSPDPHEVAEVFEVPLAFLLETANHRYESAFYKGRLRHYWAMPWQGRFIWGATAGMLVTFQRIVGRTE